MWHNAKIIVASVLLLNAAAAPLPAADSTYSRMMARHLGKHLPGNPGIVVQNMPGVGQLIAANHLYNRSAPDGLTSATSPAVIFRHVLGDKGAMLDGRKFGWVGTPPPERHACVVTESTGVKTLADWSASKRPLKFGALGPGNSTPSAWPHLLKSALVFH